MMVWLPVFSLFRINIGAVCIEEVWCVCLYTHTHFIHSHSHKAKQFSINGCGAALLKIPFWFGLHNYQLIGNYFGTVGRILAFFLH